METELLNAINIVKENGFTVITKFKLKSKSYVKEITDLLEEKGYRVEKAECERSSGLTGRLNLTIYPPDVSEII